MLRTENKYFSQQLLKIMLKETVLALIWSAGGPLEKKILQDFQPDVYATTKALSVTVGYVIARQPVDFSLFKSPYAWILLLMSMCNTPLYARIVK